MFGSILTLACVGGAALYFINYFMRNNLQVGPTEHVVLKNVFTGQTQSYQPGMHFPGPEMEKFKTFPTTVQENTIENMEVNLQGGIVMKVDCRFNWIIGRAFKEVVCAHNPAVKMIDFDGPPETAEVDDALMKRAAEKIDIEHIADQVREGLKGAFEQIFRSLSDEQLQDPKNNNPRLPTRDISGMAKPHLVTTAEDMLELLGEQIRMLANQTLVAKFGLGLTNVNISNADDTSEKLREARTKRRILELNAEAVSKAKAKLPNAGKDIDATAMALFGDPAAMAEATKANALKELAKAIPLIRDLIHIENKR